MSLVRSEAIREVWRSNIWNHADILALTTKKIEHDLGEESLHEVSKLRHETKINFFAFRVARAIQALQGDKNRLFFDVEITYTRYADPSGANYNAVIDGIEILQELVISELGSNWGGTVAMYQAQEGVPSVSTITIDGEVCFSADFNYSAMICVDS